MQRHWSKASHVTYEKHARDVSNNLSTYIILFSTYEMICLTKLFYCRRCDQQKHQPHSSRLSATKGLRNGAKDWESPTVEVVVSVSLTLNYPHFC